MAYLPSCLSVSHHSRYKTMTEASPSTAPASTFDRATIDTSATAQRRPRLNCRAAITGYAAHSDGCPVPSLDSRRPGPVDQFLLGNFLPGFSYKSSGTPASDVREDPRPGVVIRAEIARAL